MSLQKEVFSGVKWTTISTVTLAFVAMLKISILTRFLDKSDFGLMAIVSFVMGFMDLFNTMGLTSAILHKQNISRKVYSSLYWFNHFVGLIMFVVLYATSPFISKFYNEPLLTSLIRIIGLNLILSGLGSMFRTVEIKNLSYKRIGIIDVLSSVVSLLFAIYFAYNNYGVYALVYSLLIQYIVSNTLLLLMGLRLYGLSFHYKYSEVLPFIKIGLFQVGSQFINYFNRDLDILLIGKFFSVDILGSYSLARELVRRPVSLINPIFSKVGAPLLSKLNNEPIKMKAYFLKLTNLLASITIPIYIGIAIFSYPIIWVLYGADYVSIALIVSILCINMIFRLIGGNVGSLVIATGRTDLDFRWNILTYLVTPIFVIIGVNFDIIMISLLISLSSVLLYVPSFHFLVKRLTNITLKEYSKAFFLVNFNQLINIKNARI